MRVARLPMMAALSFALCLGMPPAAAEANRSADSPRESDATRNLRDFDFLVENIRRNYAGWHDKVTPETEARLAELTEAICAEVPTASDQKLAELFGRWIAFFGDKHLAVRQVSGAPDAVPGQKAARPGPTEAQLRRQGESTAAPAPIEGIWQIDSSYRLALLHDKKDPKRFLATILNAENPNWKPGEIKAEIREQDDGTFAVTYYDGNRGANALTGRLLAGATGFQIRPFGTWTKAWPQVADQDRIRREAAGSDLFLEALSDKTLWLRLPDFGDQRAEPLKALLDEHKDALSRAPNMIIDLRDNGGGSDYVYGPVIDLVYTRPIISIDAELRATEDNIAIREQQLEAARTEFPGAVEGLTEQIEAMRGGIGGYVRSADRPFSITTRDVIRENPRHVAILIDGAGSSGEEFLLAARQSYKVTLFGQANSAGVLDHANVVLAPMPSGRFNIAWPISRSLRLPEYPVDPDGIAPDIRIPADIDDPILYLQQWLER